MGGPADNLWRTGGVAPRPGRRTQAPRSPSSVSAQPLCADIAALTCGEQRVVHSFHRPYDNDGTYELPDAHPTAASDLPGENSPRRRTAPGSQKSPDLPGAPGRMAGCSLQTCGRPPCGSPPAASPEDDNVKFRVERDALADAVAWAARSLPIRPSVPVLAGLLIEAGHEGLVLSTFDYETSARATLTAEVTDEGKALVSGRLLADICRSLPGQAGRDGARRLPGLADLRLRPVQPADDAGRGLPHAAGHAGRDRHRAERRRSPTPSPRRSPPPAATTCCRC